MSWWTDFRDDLETVGGLVANYFYPGTIALGQLVNSKGSQQQLFGTTWGQLAGLATGIGGAYAAGAGSAAGAGAGSIGGATDSGLAGGFTSAGTAAAADPETLEVARQMLQQQASPAEVLQMTGITPAQAEAAGFSAGAGQTWADVAQQSGIPYSGSGGYDTGLGQMPGGGGGGGFGGAGGGAPSFGGAGAAASPIAKQVGAMPWGSAGNIATMGQGLLGLGAAGGLLNAGRQAQQAADPFAPYRAEYAQKMKDLMEDPSKITSQPGYEAGIQAIKRSMASQGYTGSGNMMAAMAKYGQDFYDKTMQMYGQYSGANANPAAAAQLGLQGTTGAISLAGQSLNRLGYGAGMAGWMGG